MKTPRQGRFPLLLVYICCAFIAGVASAAVAIPPVLPPAAVTLAIVVAPRRDLWWALLLLACCAALLAGDWRYSATAYHEGPAQVAYYAGRSVVIVGVVDGEPRAANHGEDLPLAVERLVVDGRQVPAGGRVLVYYTGAQQLGYGDRLNVSGGLDRPTNPPGFDYRAYLAGQGIHATLSFPRVQVLAHGAGNHLQGLAYGLRETLRRAMDGMLPHDEAALLIGILLGAPTRSLGALTAPFVTVGMIHVVAISGLKVALVAGTATLLCARLPMRVRWLPAMAAVAAYALVSGATPSGLRAALMWGLVVLALQLGRRAYVWVSLALVAALMVGVDPLLLWDSGFQLSVVGTAGIVAFTPWFERYLPDLPPGRHLPLISALVLILRESTAVSLAAQLTTLPLTAAGFGQVSLAAPLANGLLLPLLGPIMAVGAVAALVAVPFPPLGHGLAYLVHPLLALTIFGVRWLAGLPFAALSWHGPGPLLAAGYYLALILLARLAGPALPPAIDRLWPGRRQLYVLGAASALLAVLGAGAAYAFDRPPGQPVLWVAGAGGSQVLLLQTPSGHAALIDGGATPGALDALLGEHLPFRQRDLALTLVSEPDVSHLGGLLGLQSFYHVTRAYDSGALYPAIAYARWRAGLRDAGVLESKVRAGQRIDLGDGVRIEVLLPVALSLDEVPAPVVYRLRVRTLAALVLNREALLDGAAALGPGIGCLDALVLPTRADPLAARALVRALRPRLVVLPQPTRYDHLTGVAALAPLPAGTSVWQATEGHELTIGPVNARCHAVG